MSLLFRFRLTGDPVFPGKKFHEVLQRNRDCEIDFEKKVYRTLTDETKDLLRRML